MKAWLSKLYIQVLIGLILGAAIGYFLPDFGIKLQPLADGFIKLIKMLLAPIIFGTIVVGIAKMGNLREVGRIGARALIYFEVVSTFALVIGLVVVNVLRPGEGMNIDPQTIDGSAISNYAKAAEAQPGFVAFLMDIIPTTMVDAFAKGSMLQIILISLLLGVALVQLGERSRPLVDVIDTFLNALFRVVAMVMRLAPIGAGAGVAFTISKYGLGTLWSLAYLMLGVYVTSILFIVLVLGTIAHWAGFPLTRFLSYFKDEILITLGTCSPRP
jgi:aerobic C4-dicarboxylate transport protein